MTILERLEQVEKWFDALKGRIHPDHHDGVKHYLEHGEPEIACELLAAGVLDSRTGLLPGEKSELLRLCVECGVDTDVALNPRQWKAIEAYLSA